VAALVGFVALPEALCVGDGVAAGAELLPEGTLAHFDGLLGFVVFLMWVGYERSCSEVTLRV
jgi:hypothetical protein